MQDKYNVHRIESCVHVHEEQKAVCATGYVLDRPVQSEDLHDVRLCHVASQVGNNQPLCLLAGAWLLILAWPTGREKTGAYGAIVAVDIQRSQ